MSIASMVQGSREGGILPELPAGHLIGGPFAVSESGARMKSRAAHRVAHEVDAGQGYANEYFAGGIEMPFGGNRQSGFGRDKGFAAIRNYLRDKSVAAKITL
jgi:hypothetical protein